MKAMDLGLRAGAVIQSFDDTEEAADVVLCLSIALEVVICMAAKDRKDALRVASAVLKDLKDDIKKNFEHHRDLCEWKESEAQEAIQ